MYKHSLHICFFTFSIAFLTIVPAFSQIGDIFKKSKKSYTTIGFGGGSSHYFGDLSPYSTFYYGMTSNVRWNGTINYQQHFNDRISARTSFSYIRIFGNDATYGGILADNSAKRKIRRLRNLHFRNDLMEFTAMGIYTFIPMETRWIRNARLQWSPYIGAGIGLSSNDPKARGSIQDKNNGYSYRQDADGVVRTQPWSSLRNLRNEDQVKIYSSIVPVFPMVLGIKTRIRENWILSIEGGLHLTLSDYLDDVGVGSFSKDPSNELSYRVDEDYDALTGKSRIERFKSLVGKVEDDVFPSTSYNLSNIKMDRSRGTKFNDTYVTTQITLNYILSNRVKCPPIPR